MTQHTSEAAVDGARTPSAIDALAERYVTDLLALHPDTATELGFPGRETEYTDFSPAGARADDELNAACSRTWPRSSRRTRRTASRRRPCRSASASSARSTPPAAPS